MAGGVEMLCYCALMRVGLTVLPRAVCYLRASDTVRPAYNRIAMYIFTFIGAILDARLRQRVSHTTMTLGAVSRAERMQQSTTA